MARKKRRLEPVATTTTPQQEAQAKARYRDPFQETVGKRIEDAGKVFEGQGRNILYGLGALLVLGIVAWLIYSWSGSSSAKAQTALGKAIETSQAQIIETPPAGSTQKTFKTEAERAEAAIAEFQAVADNYGGSVGEKAKYFVAVNRLKLDRPAGIAALQELSGNSGEVGSLAKFALAQARAADGQMDEAANLYSELAKSSDPVIAKETIQFELASVYEKQGKKAEAVEVLFDLVKTASEAKDMEGKAVPLTSTGLKAKDKLTELDPEKAKELPQPEATDPTAAGAPF
jgi:tetratricopeptide (TPR) repeat protein